MPCVDVNGDYTAPAALAAKALGKPVKFGADASRRPAVRLVSLAVMRTYPFGGGFGRRLSSDVGG
jgi:hypothetical protein